jgi:hypothetical protein
MALTMLKKGCLATMLAMKVADSYLFAAPIAQPIVLNHRFLVPAQDAQGTYGVRRAAVTAGSRPASTLPNIAGVAARVTPSVVHISVSGSKNLFIGARPVVTTTTNRTRCRMRRRSKNGCGNYRSNLAYSHRW